MQKFVEYIERYERPKRKAISSRFPILVGPAVFTKRSIRLLYNFIFLSKLQKEIFLPCVIARHSSPLYRRLGDSETYLQKNKVTNLQIAIALLDRIVIPTGAVFSLWDIIGSVTKQKGYVEGMLLSNGKVSVGMGGGLCQLSNFLMWIFLHADIEIIERHHHSVDAFPDSGRTLPFGSGATIFSNYLDLQIKNTSDSSLQLKLWLTKASLKGQLLSTKPAAYKYHVREVNHCFLKRNESFFRYNEIYRETLKEGVSITNNHIFTNFAPVAYDTNEVILTDLGYTVISVPI